MEQTLISQLRTLAQQQVAEVVDRVEFLAAEASKRAALDRLLAIAPALEAAGVQPMSEEEIAAEVKAARAESPITGVTSTPTVSPSSISCARISGTSNPS